MIIARISLTFILIFLFSGLTSLPYLPVPSFTHPKQVYLVIQKNEDRTIVSIAPEIGSRTHSQRKDFILIFPVSSQSDVRVERQEKNIFDEIDSATSPKLILDQESGRDILHFKKPFHWVSDYKLESFVFSNAEKLHNWAEQHKTDLKELNIEKYFQKGSSVAVLKIILKSLVTEDSVFLKPFQISIRASHFSLPISLSPEPQEYVLALLSKNNELDISNYRTVRVPSDIELPNFVQDEFWKFYDSCFDRLINNETMPAVFLEYAGAIQIRGAPLFATRYRFRYLPSFFLQDLEFKPSDENRFFQSQYILKPDLKISKETEKQREKEAQNLARLTNWNIREIRKKLSLKGRPPRTSGRSWFEKLWKD